MSDSNQMMDDQKSQADIQKEHARYIKPLGDWKRSHNCGALSLADDGRENSFWPSRRQSLHTASVYLAIYGTS